MIRQFIAVGLFAGFVLAGAGEALSQSTSSPVPVAVNEAAARAILAGDTIQLHLPLTAPAASGLRITAQTLSPVDAGSGEATAEIEAGSREAVLTIPWPSDRDGKPVKDIGWYRIGYKILAGGTIAAKGILAIGAITSNLLDLRLASPEPLVTGVPLNVRIYAGHPVLKKPFRGVLLEARLVIDPDNDADTEAAPKTIVREAITDRTGEAIVRFPFPTKPGQTATLTVVGTLTGAAGPGQSEARVTASVSKDFTARDKTTIRVETDKPLHKPGEIVHLRALVFNNAGHAAANFALALTIKDQDNKTLLEVPVTTNRFGIASYDWKTGPQLAPGDYDASFNIGDSSNNDSSESTTIRIQRYELPEFAVVATMDNGYYLEGQSPVVKIHAGYLFGKPVAAGSLRLARAGEGEWDWRTGKYKKGDKPEQTATLDANGDAELHLNVKSDFDDLKQSDYEPFTNLEYRAIVTDATTGRSEPRSFTVRLSKDPVHIYLQPLGSDDHEGDYYLSTSYADGVPASAKVTLDWMDAESRATRAASVTTNRYGLAKVHLRYPALEPGESDINLRVIALDAEGRKSKLDDTIYPERARRTWITVAHSLLKQEEPIEALIHAPLGSTIDVDVLTENGLLAHQQVHMSHPAESLIVPISPDFHGLVTLRAYAMNSDQPQYSYYWGGGFGYKAVLYPQDRALKVKLTGLQSSYAPGATVNAGLAVSDAIGSVPPGALGIAVIDTAVELRAQTEEEANDRWFGFDWWRPSQAVAGITRETLDQTDMSKPVLEDFDLAAEALLDSSPVSGIQIDTAIDNGDQYLYESGMRRDLQLLGKAVLEARPAQLPADSSTLASIARAAKLDDSILIDPWNTPYKANRSIASNYEVLTMVSAGPDKRFGTEDDIDLELTRRNLFELPGERLARLLDDATKAGKSLPGTIDGLKALSRNGGLDLDSIFDPRRKPYTYAILVSRRYYSIQVLVQPGETVWTSPSIDYFSATEARMERAIQDWINAGKPFPDTESEAREAFTKAGIDFDAFRDPFGKPFQLRSSQVMTYTRAEKVKAGSSLDVKSKPVTHLLRAIQVLRAPDQSTGQNAAGDADVVAQFLHPITEQSGSDLKPQPVDQGTFKGNTGAIGGTVTDQTGAVIPRAVVEVETSGGVKVASAETVVNGAYLIPDLAPGFYSLKVSARGFETFELREVHVSPVALTTVDAELLVGSNTQTVTVEADASPMLATESAVISGRNASELVSVSKGVVGPDGKVVVAGRNGKATISEPTFTPRLRHVFEETAYWAPSLETNAAGHVALHFPLPDSLTTWKLHALASTTDGRVGVLDQTFKTFQPFFVDLDAPQVLTIGDEITLPVNLRNYTAHALALPVIAKPADWFSLLAPGRVDASVPANGTTPVVFGFRASKAVEAGPLRITAANTQEGDAVEKTVRVHPDGEPRVATASGLLRSGASTLTFELPVNVIPGSVHADLLLYPNLRAHILQAMKAVLERPYGCGEQTISSTYPNLLFLELLKAAGATSSKEGEAQNYLQLGYDRLLGYFDPSGGLTYWGEKDHDPDPALTAYGIEFLAEAQPYVKVDQGRIVNAISWLISRQQADGGWKPHYGDSTADLNLYIASVLKRTLSRDDMAKATTQELRDRADKAVAKAAGWATSSVAAVHDPYSNALRLRLATDNAERARLRAELARTAVHDRNGAHWSRDGYSPFYGWGYAGELETTAQVLAALGNQGPSAEDRALAGDALFYLLKGQDRYGIWYSGQATVRVLQALLPMAEEEMKTPAGGEQFRLTVNGVALTEKDAEALRPDATLPDAPRSFDLTSMVKPSHNELVFTSESGATLASAEASVSYYVPWPETAKPMEAKTQTGADYGLDFGYHCAAEQAHVGNPIDCAVDLRRFGSNSYGMLLAEVGLPPGADVDRVSLGKLLDNWTVSRYELQPDRIVFYIWSWRAEGTHFSFRFTPRYAIRAKAAPATLSDYYNPDFKSVLAPQTFVVTDPDGK
jgi:hypothetical protein